MLAIREMCLTTCHSKDRVGNRVYRSDLSKSMIDFFALATGHATSDPQVQLKNVVPKSCALLQYRASVLADKTLRRRAKPSDWKKRIETIASHLEKYAMGDPAMHQLSPDVERLLFRISLSNALARNNFSVESLASVLPSYVCSTGYSHFFSAHQVGDSKNVYTTSVPHIRAVNRIVRSFPQQHGMMVSKQFLLLYTNVESGQGLRSIKSVFARMNDLTGIVDEGLHKAGKYGNSKNGRETHRRDTVEMFARAIGLTNWKRDVQVENEAKIRLCCEQFLQECTVLTEGKGRGRLPDAQKLTNALLRAGQVRNFDPVLYFSNIESG
jgi:hypothetical protein